jgi:WhiB family redox-sensing transcriptional regulator
MPHLRPGSDAPLLRQEGLRMSNDFQDLAPREAWMTDALCAQSDPEIFFPERGSTARPGKRVCAACDVRAECLQYALDHGERFGVWGGLTANERTRLRKKGAA